MDPRLPEIVRRVAGRVLSERGLVPEGRERPARTAGVDVRVAPCDGPPRPADGPGGGAGDVARSRGTELVTALDLAGIADGGRLDVPPGARVTPAAEDEAWRRGIRLARRGASAAVPADRDVLRVAVAADHGGFAMKQRVLEWVLELGHRAVDFGTGDENPVDYPDVARRAAEAVASGQCDFAIVVDGAGIGSAIAANKVPGVRAAMCYDEATARNAREHNFANVLTLGGRMLGDAAACAVVRTFLATREGAERHRRRVDKITAIERYYARRP